jgi:tRNA(Ile)-lysidine synthase TilS/MesJ
MVLARILIYLRNHGLCTFTDIVAVHIDYANRPESSLEASYLENYCKKHNIIFEKRVINEVTRDVTDRDEYERVARTIRYSFYQEILTKYLPHYSNRDTKVKQGMIFGHHAIDVQENVISNVMRLV